MYTSYRLMPQSGITVNTSDISRLWEVHAEAFNILKSILKQGLDEKVKDPKLSPKHLLWNKEVHSCTEVLDSGYEM